MTGIAFGYVARNHFTISVADALSSTVGFALIAEPAEFWASSSENCAGTIIAAAHIVTVRTKLSNLTALIGSRELLLSGNEEVVVSLGVPSPIGEGEDEYYCPYHISGLEEEGSGRVVGADALQAIQLVLVRIGAILYTSKEWQSGLLTWHGERNLGFPLPDSLKDLQL